MLQGFLMHSPTHRGLAKWMSLIAFIVKKITRCLVAFGQVGRGYTGNYFARLWLLFPVRMNTYMCVVPSVLKLENWYFCGGICSVYSNQLVILIRRFALCTELEHKTFRHLLPLQWAIMEAIYRPLYTKYKNQIFPRPNFTQSLLTSISLSWMNNNSKHSCLLTGDVINFS